jgi:hypothetical protein
MIHKGICILIVVLFCISFTSYSQQEFYKYSKSSRKEKINIDLITEFEIGFHAGTNWTLGSTTNIAQYGQVFSLNLGWNNGKIYGGTEFNLKFWNQILNDEKAREINFKQNQFLWLLHMKWYMKQGGVQPFLGAGTDLVTIAEGILNPKDDDWKRDDYEDHKFFNYNAWFVPTVGIRFKVRKYLYSEISSTIDISDNYNSMRLQVGFIYQPQF